MKSILTTAISALLCLAGPALSQSQVYAAWTQIEGSRAAVKPAGDFMDLWVSLRIVLPGSDPNDACPDFKVAVDYVTGSTVYDSPFLPRNATTATDGFGVQVCQFGAINNQLIEARLLQADGQTPVTLSGTNRPVVFKGASTVSLNETSPGFIVLGDSGCRGGDKQNCDNSQPSDKTGFFLETVASMAQQRNPQFVIHVGDYRYDDNIYCTGNPLPSTCGDPAQEPIKWQKWQSDFFSRVRSGLLMDVPWAFSRGNHEWCDGAGPGYNYFFGDITQRKTCDGYDKTVFAPWYFDVTDRSTPNAQPHRFVMMDAQPASESYVQALSWADTNWSHIANAKPSAWLVHHLPLWAIEEGTERNNGKNVKIIKANNSAEETALADAVSQLPASSTCAQPYDNASCGFKSVLSGHTHMLQNFGFVDNALPQQYAIGLSGVRLDHSFAEESCRFPLPTLGMVGPSNSNMTGALMQSKGRDHHTTGDDNFGYGYFVRDASQATNGGWSGMITFVDGRTEPLDSAANLTQTDVNNLPVCEPS